KSVSSTPAISYVDGFRAAKVPALCNPVSPARERRQANRRDYFPASSLSGRFAGASFPCRRLHRRDDFRIRRAPAQVAGQVIADAFIIRVGMLVEQLPDHENEARRAEAALKGTLFDERLLDRVERTVAVEMLDRLHVRAVGEDGEEQAAGHGAAVHD